MTDPSNVTECAIYPLWHSTGDMVRSFLHRWLAWTAYPNIQILNSYVARVLFRPSCSSLFSVAGYWTHNLWDGSSGKLSPDYRSSLYSHDCFVINYTSSFHVKVILPRKLILVASTVQYIWSKRQRKISESMCAFISTLLQLLDTLCN
jgi:hypothetical protein